MDTRDSATLQPHKNLHVAHGAEEAKRSRIAVPETSNMQEGQKQEAAVNEEDYLLSPRTHG